MPSKGDQQQQQQQQQQGGGRRRSKDQGAKKNPLPKSSPSLGSSSEASPQQWGEMASTYYTQHPLVSQFNAKEAQKQLNDYWVYANEQCSDPYSAGRVVEHKEPTNPPNYPRMYEFLSELYKAYSSIHNPNDGNFEIHSSNTILDTRNSPSTTPSHTNPNPRQKSTNSAWFPS